MQTKVNQDKNKDNREQKIVNMSSCSSLLSSRAIEAEENRVAAAQNAAEAILNNRGTDSETSSARNGTYGSTNARYIPIEHNYPEIMAGNPNYPIGIYVSDDIVSGSRLPGGRMS